MLKNFHIKFNIPPSDYPYKMKKMAALIYIAIILISLPLYIFMLSNLNSLPILSVIFIIGIYLLVKGSDYFVEGAASIATHKKVSQHTIGLTLVALATSLPEFAVSTIASFSHHPDTSWGNVIGSNIANIGLVLGTAAILMPLLLSKHIKKDVGVLVVITAILFLLSWVFGRILWWMGILFILIYILYLWEIRGRREEIEEVEIEHSWLWSWAYTLFGAFGIVWGARIVVDSAIHIAIVLHIPEIVIAITAVAVGTSLPELVTSVMAALKKKYGIAVGNVIGSNIFNILIVLGASSLLNPIVISQEDMMQNMIFLNIFTLAAALMCWMRRIRRWEGVVLLLLYFIFILFLII